MEGHVAEVVTGTDTGVRIDWVFYFEINPYLLNAIR